MIRHLLNYNLRGWIDPAPDRKYFKIDGENRKKWMKKCFLPACIEKISVLAKKLSLQT
ncbi:MAG: hypothetical protein LUH00_06620 [Lachnospiraceae bacterium]|nr:hypothetical protein [Lachnospiraceae bacterium]